jgi:hypothetical protein
MDYGHYKAAAIDHDRLTAKPGADECKVLCGTRIETRYHDTEADDQEQDDTGDTNGRQCGKDAIHEDSFCFYWKILCFSEPGVR